MSDASPERPNRRPRYSGPNPRGFHEKYKEHRPESYPDDLAKVIAGGRTPAGSHRPIMVREILEILDLKPGKTVADCTLGYGGHARELLAAVQPGGRLIAVDADPIELPKTEARLLDLGFPAESLVLRRMNYAGLPDLLAAEAPGGVDAALADLGLSSMQIDDPKRGFTYKVDAPLDMRMNPEKGEPASALLAKIAEPVLSALLLENADEPLHAQVAAALIRARSRTPIATTTALADLVRAVAERRRVDPASMLPRVFQAIRIAVNDEFATLEALLRRLPAHLKPGARAAILTFHSGEDRRVKSAFKDGLRAGVFAEIAEEPIRASAEERRSNPRASSAKLRWAVRRADDPSFHHM